MIFISFSSYGCGIEEQEFVVLTGGDYSAADVVKLSQEGEAETLPSLNQGRSRHACGKFTNSDGSIVRYISEIFITKCPPISAFDCRFTLLPAATILKTIKLWPPPRR